MDSILWNKKVSCIWYLRELKACDNLQFLEIHNFYHLVILFDFVLMFNLIELLILQLLLRFWVSEFKFYIRWMDLHDASFKPFICISTSPLITKSELNLRKLSWYCYCCKDLEAIVPFPFKIHFTLIVSMLEVQFKAVESYPTIVNGDHGFS